MRKESTCRPRLQENTDFAKLVKKSGTPIGGLGEGLESTGLNGLGLSTPWGKAQKFMDRTRKIFMNRGNPPHL